MNSLATLCLRFNLNVFTGTESNNNWQEYFHILVAVFQIRIRFHEDSNPGFTKIHREKIQNSIIKLRAMDPEAEEKV